MQFWIWVGRIKTPMDAATKLAFFVTLAASLNHLRAVLADYPNHHSFGTSFFDAAFAAVPLGILALMLLKRLGDMQDELEFLASTDPLTKLPNRRVMMDRLCGVLDQKGTGCFLMADIDFFKRINDAYGHAGGDNCLCDVADLLRDVCPPCADIARIGGEEFAVLMPDTVASRARITGERLSLGVLTELAGVEERITLSVGITAIRPDDDLQDVMRNARRKSSIRDDYI